MKIGIVGASASGIYLALLLKKHNPSLDVTLIEKEDKIAKKVFATGNGRCNLLHHEPSSKQYDHPEIFEKGQSRYTFSTLLACFEDWGIPLVREGNLYYPASLSAPSFVYCLQSLLQEAEVKTLLSTKVNDYRPADQGIIVMTSKGDCLYDALVFASGGKSGKNLGSDGSLFPVLTKHGYRIEDCRSGLCPIKTKEKFPSLNGIRVDGSLKIVLNDLVFKEEGQILFKKDGLSGIVVFNAENFLVEHHAPKGTKITVSLFSQYKEEELVRVIQNVNEHPHGLSALFPRPLADFFDRLHLAPKALAHRLKNWEFTYEEPYSFQDSQVTIGGVSWQNIDPMYLNSKKEPSVFFVGEALDMAGNCGGYNLTWCLLSALMCEEGIHEILR